MNSHGQLGAGLAIDSNYVVPEPLTLPVPGVLCDKQDVLPGSN
jgi:hypothetical protein